MFTYKQLEAVFWIAELGGFGAAARKLNTTQSAISKRVQELESVLGASLFERDKRQARLSQKGEEVLLLAKHLLEQRDAAIDQLGNPDVIARRVRIGVTELTAITWLPRLVASIRGRYPKIVLEPDVDSSMSLRDKLLADEMDMIIVPNAVADARFINRKLGTVKLSWMCKPGLLPTSRIVTLQELTEKTIFSQGSRSGTSVLFEAFFRSKEFLRANTITSNNMLALIGLTVAGLGVSYLPATCLKPLISRRALAVVRTSPALPPVDYVASFKSTRNNMLIASIAEIASSVCDFSELFQLAGQEKGRPLGFGDAFFGNGRV
jgi:DNA-binding transcriptional LysR family regulator